MTDKLKEAVARSFSPFGFDGLSEVGRQRLRVSAQDALDAITAQGFAIVPVEPTEAMVKAGGTCKPWMAGWPKGDEAAADVYRAMIQAAGEVE